MTRVWYDEMRVECEGCDAATGEACSRTDGPRLGLDLLCKDGRPAPHAVRVRRWRESRTPEYVPRVR